MTLTTPLDIYNYYSGYWQDDWRIGSFTLNYGLRIDTRTASAKWTTTSPSASIRRRQPVEQRRHPRHGRSAAAPRPGPSAAADVAGVNGNKA
jgi:hypothetical protein